MRRFVRAACIAVLASSCAVIAAYAASSEPSHIDASYLRSVSWRLVGPFRGGRALAVTGVPGEPDHFYFGAVDGGVWESTNAGRTWEPIFDREDVGSIGAIAVAPSDPKTMYVGTGEADMRSDVAYGNGVYVSRDAGKTWQHAGLEDTMQIGAIVVDPRDANVAYVAALGHAYAANPQRGVFKTTDGGKTWTKVLYKDENAGAISLAIDPQHPQTLYAALWQTRRPPWNVYPPSNGPGSGLYKTSDGGKTWTQLTDGLPKNVGRIGIAVSPSRPSRVYAIVDAYADIDAGGVYRSEDYGATWKHVAGGKTQERIWKRGWYFGGITADPRNPDVVYVMDTATYRSTDGGKTFEAIKGSPGGDDYHTLWIEPNDPNRMILGGDQGVVVTMDGGKTWSSWLNQPTAQLYHISTDNRFPYWLYGAQQDSGAIAMPSQSIHQNLTWNDWRFLDSGGENGEIAADLVHPGNVFGGSDTVSHEELSTGWEQIVDPQIGYPLAVWRHTWTLPLVFSPVDHRTLFTGRQKIFRTGDGGKSWTIVSPDLTRANDNTAPNLDPATIEDSTGLPRRGVVYAIGPSPLDAQLIWAGTDDGYVWITRDGGAHWANVTPKELTAWSKVGVVEPSPFDKQTAYLAIDRHRLNDYAPYIYKTNDGGVTWSLAVNGIPNGSFVNVVRADPKERDLLYAGTEKGIYISFDDGANWQSLQRNLPVTSIRDIDVHGDDLAIATHGRSAWIMDDIEPLREAARAAAHRSNYLYAPPVTYRAMRAGGVTTPSQGFGGIADEGTPIQPDEPQAPNPPFGMPIDYYLHGTPSTPVVIDVADAQGSVVRHYSSAAHPKITDPSTVDIAPRWIARPSLPSTDPGAQRFYWNFHTKRDDGPLAPPGAYTIRLEVDGKTYSRVAELRRDPRINVTDAQLLEQYDFANEIDAQLARIGAARARVEAVLKRGTLPPAQAEIVRTRILGVAPPENPDNSVGVPATNLTTLRYLSGTLTNLEADVESADAAPTPDMRKGYDALVRVLDETLGKAARLSR
jgi:photosystem II stability/assembly factor-like uncharacterized protein